jgi:hypothetical protein
VQYALTDSAARFLKRRRGRTQGDAVAALLYSNRLYSSGHLAPMSTIYYLMVGVYYNSILQRTDPNVQAATWSINTIIQR